MMSVNLDLKSDIEKLINEEVKPLKIQVAKLSKAIGHLENQVATTSRDIKQLVVEFRRTIRYCQICGLTHF